jgi:hypothetical protein
LVDVVFFGRFAYYFFINVNSRWLYAVCANARVRDGERVEIFAEPSQATCISFYADALEDFLPDMGELTLRGDAEGAFSTPDRRVQELYERFGTTFIPLSQRLILNTRRQQKTAPYHSSLAIMDSVVRTIRDMSYNVGLGANIDPLAMNQLIGQYKLAPHSTLTKYGPGFAISPWMAQRDPELRAYIARRMTQDNMEVRRRQGFDLPIGTKCLVYNDISQLDKRRSSTRPEHFIVVGYNHGIYTLEGIKSKIRLSMPRWKVKPV